jgi:hypothetical protein
MTSEAPKSRFLLGLGLALSCTVLGLFAGGFFGSLMISKADGMAGAVEVLAYALMGGLILLVSAIVLVKQLPRRISIRLLLIAAPLALILLTYATWHFRKNKAEKDRQWELEQEKFRHMKPTAPTRPAMFFTTAPFWASAQGPQREEQGHFGLGFVSLRISTGSFHFYGDPDMDALPVPQNANDSLVLVMGEHHVDIASAPPWFVPAHMKMDYDLLLLKAITLSQNWIEVEVNSIDGSTRWVASEAVDFTTWTEFILAVPTVEIIDPGTNPIRIKPLDHASEMADGADALLKPLAVRGEWLMVSTSDLADRMPPTGWIRWRKGDRLLVRYNLLC